MAPRTEPTGTAAALPPRPTGRAGGPPLRAIACLGVSTSLLLGGCTSPGPSEPAGEPEPATVAWAGAVCSDVTDVRSAIGGIGDDLSLNPLAGTAGLTAAREQLEGQLRQVGQEFAELRSRIAAAPDEPAAQEARESLADALDAVESAADAAGSRARDALGADSVQAAISAAVGAVAAVGDALGAIGGLVRTATGAASGTSAEVRAAFQNAPACDDLT